MATQTRAERKGTAGLSRDQLMLEILLDIRDLFAVTPAAPATSGQSALEKLAAIKRLTGR